MLNTDSKIELSMSIPAISTETSIKSGSGVILKMEGGVAKASNGSASTAELFLGVAMTEFVLPSIGVFAETIKAPAGGGTVTLTKTPVGGATAVRFVQVGGSLDVAGQAGAASSGEVQVVGAVATFNTAEGNKIFKVVYRYNLTVAEAEYLWGSGVAGNSANAMTHTMSVITKGIVWTDQFDTGADWYADNIKDICVLAGGLFGRGANGAPTTLKVAEVPTVEKPFLGLIVG